MVKLRAAKTISWLFHDCTCYKNYKEDGITRKGALKFILLPLIIVLNTEILG